MQVISAARQRADNSLRPAARRLEEARRRYRAQQMDDATFLEYRRKHDAALAAWEAAEKQEKPRQRWTSADVREVLPDLTVKLRDGRLVKARISGRRNPFATVWTAEGHSAEFAWSTLALILTNDTVPTI